MDFWEKCLVRTYHGFCENYDRGRENLNWWIGQVLDWKLLQLHKVSNDGLIVLKMVTDGNDSAFQQVKQELVNRNLKGGQLELGSFVMSWQRKSIDTWSRMACLGTRHGRSAISVMLSRESLKRAVFVLMSQARKLKSAAQACFRPSKRSSESEVW
ncbi:MAG: hypothetical protein U0930_10960 [Pirellulales bacterium]